MNSHAVLALYDAQMRIDPPPRNGVTHTHTEHVVRITGDYNCIEYYRFGAEEAAQRVEAEIAFFSKCPGRMEWKIHGHDEPKNIAALLAQAGFEAEETETLLAFDLETDDKLFQAEEHIDIRRVRDRTGLDDMIAAASEGFASDFSGMSVYERRLNDAETALYVAYLGEKPVGTGRLEMPANTCFAMAYIGSVVPEFRGRGIYRALIGARIAQAKRNGFRYLATEARETSRPILERLGFVPLTTVRGWVKIF